MPRPASASVALALGLLVVSGSAPPAASAGAGGEFAVKGLGADTCANFVKASAEKLPSVREFRGWVEGYLTAVNRYRTDTFDVAPWQSTALLLTLIHAHCQQSPDDRLFEVVHQLQELLAADRMVARSKVVEVGEGEQKVALYAEILKRAQQALIDRGLLEGAADGVYGPKTRAALEAFQKQAGLPVTGLPDQPTLFDLLLRPKLEG